MSYLAAFLARKRTNAVAVLRTPDGTEGIFPDEKPQNLTAKTDKSHTDNPFGSFGSDNQSLPAKIKAEPEPDTYGAELAALTREAVRVRFTGADAETAWPAADFYALAGRLAAARYVVELCADEKMRGVWLAQIDAYHSARLARRQQDAPTAPDVVEDPIADIYCHGVSDLTSNDSNDLTKKSVKNAKKQAETAALISPTDNTEEKISDRDALNLTAKTAKSPSDIPFVSFDSSFLGIHGEKIFPPEPDTDGTEEKISGRDTLNLTAKTDKSLLEYPFGSFVSSKQGLPAKIKAEPEPSAPCCPFCQAPAARCTVQRYERMTHDPDTGAALAEPIRAIVEDVSCALCGELIERAADFNEDLLTEVEERAAIMEYDGGLTRAEAERRAEWETLWLRFCASDAALLEM